MSARSFLPFEEFNIESFVDYGRKFYDNNRFVDGPGVTFRH